MPKKKKKKPRVKKKVSRKVKPRVKKKVSRKVKPKVKKKVSRKVKTKVKNGIEKELVFKTKPEWVKSALINKKKYNLAFKLYPTNISQVITIAEKRKYMPQKSTWFHPKPLDGLISSKIIS